MIPVILISGYLGSGKTTLVNHLLAHSDASRTAVVVNEMGDVGLDHLLIEQLTEDIALLEAGCLCCAAGEDIAATLVDLRARSIARGAEIERVYVETTGAADPGPIIARLGTDPALQRFFRYRGLVTVVDTVFGLAQLETLPEAAQQAALADLLVLNKTDQAPRPVREALREALVQVNPAAPLVQVHHGALPPAALEELAAGANASLALPAGPARHAIGLASVTLDVPAPLSRAALVEWLEALVHARGADLMRLKGVVALADEPRPQLVHGLRHMFYPLRDAPASAAAMVGKLVLIGRGLDRAGLQASIEASARAWS